jgi:predicted phage terminase large subunit-like protein
MEHLTIERSKTIIRRIEKKPELNKYKKALQDPLSLLRKLNDKSLYNFIRCFWSEISQDEFKPNWHIQYLCQQLEIIAERVGTNQHKAYDLIINIPPGTTKTITCSIMFPVWCWTKWYWMRFITTSYSAALSLESAEYSRDLIRSDKFQMLYPELDIKQDKDTKSNFRVVKKYQVSPGHAPRIDWGGNRYSTSVGGTLTGFHAHILIVDDPLNPHQAMSETELLNCNRWMEQTLPTRKTDKAVTPMVLIMQRLHEDDPSGHLLEKKKANVKHISLPGEILNYKDQLKPIELEQYYEDGLLDTKRMSWDILKDLEADLGQYGYSGQVGQKPTPPGGGMFKVDHFQTILTMPAPVNVIQSVRYWDKAGTDAKEIKKGGKACYTAGTKMNKLASGKWVISDMKRGRWSSEEREQIIRETAEADGRDVEIGVEQEPGSGGKESAQGTIRNLAGYSVFAECPTGDKIFRADPYSVQVNNGNVMLLKGDWNYEFIKEHENFPFSTYKDQVDASSGAFNRLISKKKVENLLAKKYYE